MTKEAGDKDFKWRQATKDDYDENGEPGNLEDPDGTQIMYWEYYVDEYGYG